MVNKKLSEYNFKELYPNKKMLSSSQMLNYEEDPSKFYLEYVLGAKRKPSVAMMVGSIFSELHHHRNFDFRSALIEIKAIRRYADLFERVIKTFPIVPAEIPLKCKYKKWTFRATLDGFSGETIIENKTGQMEWTQARADLSDQITFQSWVYLKKYGKVPKVILLNWVDLRARAEINPVCFKTKRTIAQLKMFEQRLDAVIEGIEVENFTNKLYF